MRLTFPAIILVLALGAGCTSSDGFSRTAAPSPSEAAAMAERAGISTDEINQATKLYNLKCARCHKFYHPADYDDGEWRRWMGKMSRKAHLSSDQTQRLARYLGAFRQKIAAPSKIE